MTAAFATLALSAMTANKVTPANLQTTYSYFAALRLVRVLDRRYRAYADKKAGIDRQREGLQLILIERAERLSKNLLQEIGRLRVAAWSTNNSVPGFVPSGESWTDRHDTDAAHWIAATDGKLIGSARFCVRDRLSDLPDGEYYAGFETFVTKGPVASLNRLVVTPESRHLGLADIFDAIRLGEAIRLDIGTIIALIELPLRLPHLKQLGFHVVGESRLRIFRDAPTLVLVWHGSKIGPDDHWNHDLFSPGFSLADDSRVQLTSNDTGWCTQIPSELNRAFIEYAAAAHGPVLDIGGGVGLASIAALRGGASVIFNDVEPRHLQVFSQHATADGLLKFKLALGRFPQQLSFEREAFAAIHASNVLHFLTPDELREGLTKMAQWLAPGGRAYIQASSLTESESRRDCR